MTEDLNSGLTRHNLLNSVSDRVEELNPGPPDYNTSALDYSATLPEDKVLVISLSSSFQEVIGYRTFSQFCKSLLLSLFFLTIWKFAVPSVCAS